MMGGGGFLSLLFWGAFALIMLQVVQGVLRNQAGVRAAHHARGSRWPVAHQTSPG